MLWLGNTVKKAAPAAGPLGRKAPQVAEVIGEYTANEAIDRGAAKLDGDSSEDTGD